MKEKPRELSRRDFLKISASAVAALGAPLPEIKTGTSVVFRFETNLPYYALTIDGGWRVDILKAMGDYLQANGMNATFFLIGEAAKYAERERPGLLRSLVEQGNDLGYHVMRGRSEEAYLKMDLGEWREDYLEFTAYLKEVLGPELTQKGLKSYLRAPWMFFTGAVMALCKEQGLTPYAASQSIRDVKNQEAIGKGEILLLHIYPNDLEQMRANLLAVSSLAKGRNISYLDGSRKNCSRGE